MGRRWLSAIFIVLVIAVFGQSYRGRQDVIESQRHGCERGITKELLNIQNQNVFIRADTRSAADVNVPVSERQSRARQVAELEAIREQRYHFVAPVNGGSLVCAKAYPDASLKPW